MLELNVFPCPTEEAKQKAIDIAFKADGLSEQLRSSGLIGQAAIVEDTRLRLLTLESEQYPGFVIASLLETADVLDLYLSRHQYDSGKRKYFPIGEGDDRSQESRLGNS